MRETYILPHYHSPMAEVEENTPKATPSDAELNSKASALQTVARTTRQPDTVKEHIPNALFLSPAPNNPDHQEFKVQRQDHWTDYKHFVSMIAAFDSTR